MTKNTLIIILIFSISACDSPMFRYYGGIENAKEELNKALNDTTNIKVVIDTLIRNKETAIKIAEPILFDIYGRENILDEKPYEAHLIDNYWVISGTMPKYMMGGTFCIILNSKNGEVIKVTHGK